MGFFQSIYISQLFSYQLNFSLVSQAESWRTRNATIYSSTFLNYWYKVLTLFQNSEFKHVSGWIWIGKYNTVKSWHGIVLINKSSYSYICFYATHTALGLHEREVAAEGEPLPQAGSEGYGTWRACCQSERHLTHLLYAAACHKLALTWSGLWHTAGQGKACEMSHPRPRACHRPGPRASSLSQPCQLLTSSRVRWKVQGRRFVIFHLLVSYNFRKRKVEDC